MQNEIDRFDEIEAYIQGKLDKNNEGEFLKRLNEDDILFQDFQLWTKLDSWFEEESYVEIESVLDEIVKDEKKTDTKFKYSNSSIFNQFIKIAACIIFTGSFCSLIYKQFYDIDNLYGSFSYTKGLYINSHSLNGVVITPQKHDRQFIDWKVEAKNQYDTTYQFIFEGGVPKRILLRVPNIKYNFKDKLSIHFNDSLASFILKIDSKKFILSQNLHWTKIKPLPPK